MTCPAYCFYPMTINWTRNIRVVPMFNTKRKWHVFIALFFHIRACSLCRVFTEMAETFLYHMVHQSDMGLGRLDMLDLLLECVSHPDYEVNLNYSLMIMMYAFRLLTLLSMSGIDWVKSCWNKMMPHWMKFLNHTFKHWLESYVSIVNWMRILVQLVLSSFVGCTRAPGGGGNN